MEFRQKGTFYRPLFEMFLCYGQEEFFECKDEQGNPNQAYLNFADMLEQRSRRISALEHRQSLQVKKEKSAKGESFTTQALPTLKGKDQHVIGLAS